jgi:uncharacterized protein (TIGR03000 family)
MFSIRFARVALPLIVLLAVAHAASAQWISKWGNPVITLGSTPYHAVSTGHGNYPGSDGFIPGYGYYPGIFESHYPWLGGPDSPDTYHMKPHGHIGGPAVAVEAESTALLVVHVAADAELWVSGVPTQQRGEWRSFVTPPLDGGRVSTYELRARWKTNGKDGEQTREVQVRPGDRVTVDLGATTELPMPRKVAP